MSQLPLPFAHEPRYGLDDFMPSESNREALAALARWPDWPDRVQLLLGPPGSGKSHLARIWAARAEAKLLTRQDFGGDLDALAVTNAVIEDAADAGIPEAALFHYLNLVRERRLSVLITARERPSAWGLSTADLVSRLRLAPSVAIEPPDDTLIRMVMVKLFADRQLSVEASVVDFLALRLDRSLDAANRAVAALDRLSLDTRRRITRPMAAELLGADCLDAD